MRFTADAALLVSVRHPLSSKHQPTHQDNRLAMNKTLPMTTASASMIAMSL